MSYFSAGTTFSTGTSGMSNMMGGNNLSQMLNMLSGMTNMLSFDLKSAASSGFGMLMNAIPTPHSDLNSSNLDSANIRSGISQALISSGNPYAMAAGAAYGIIDKTGGFNDASMSLSSEKNAINKVGSILLPGAGYFLSSTDKYKRSEDSLAMSSGYSGFLDFAGKVEQDAGGKFLVGRSEINRNVTKAKAMDSLISTIKLNRDNDFDAMYSMTLNIGVGNQYNLNGGFNASYARAAKNGLKVKNLNWARSLAKGGKASDLEFAKFEIISPQLNSLKLKHTVTIKKDPETTNKKLDWESLDPDITISNLEDSIIINSIDPQGQTEESLRDPEIKIDTETLTFLNLFLLDNGVYLVPLNIYENLDSNLLKHLKDLGILILVISNKEMSESNPGAIHGSDFIMETPLYKLGGSFNVIPEGALHKNKHHMEDAEGLTKKGIPVVTEEDGKLIQQAEIERLEIVLHLELTEKLEAMLKEYTDVDDLDKKDEIAIYAGKLLTKEILHNTKDKANLIEEC